MLRQFTRSKSFHEQATGKLTCRTRIKNLDQALVFITLALGLVGACGIPNVWDLVKLFPFAQWKLVANVGTGAEVQMGASLGGMCSGITTASRYRWTCTNWYFIDTSKCDDLTALTAETNAQMGYTFMTEAGWGAFCNNFRMHSILTILLIVGTLVGTIGRRLIGNFVLDACIENEGFKRICNFLMSLISTLCLSAVAVIYLIYCDPSQYMKEMMEVTFANSLPTVQSREIIKFVETNAEVRRLPCPLPARARTPRRRPHAPRTLS